MLRNAIRRITELELALLGVAALLAAETLAAVLVPQIGVATVNPGLDLVLNSAATFAAGGIAALTWARWREARDVASLYQASAFLGLFVVNAGIVAASLGNARGAVGLDLADPGQLPVYVLSGSRLTAATLLAIGGVGALAGWRASRHHGWVIGLGPTVVLVVLVGIGQGVQSALPPLLNREAIAALGDDPTQPLLGQAGAWTVVQALTAAVYLAAAYAYLRLHGRDRQPLHGYLAVGLVIAAFGQLHQGLHPGVYASLVTSGDLLRTAFYGLLLIGVDAERRTDIRALRQANRDLVRLQEAEVTRAALEERARLAREVHDGLAQDLWFAKLKQGRLARDEQLDDAGRTLVGEVLSAIDSALAEARQAVMALRSDPRGDSFADTLQRYVEDFGDRFGLRAEFEASGDVASLGVRAQAEVLRIMQEALNNVSKHADATLVRVRAVRENGEVALSIVDNGRGFDPAAVDPGRFGLVSMRERAALVGGTLTVESARHDGTTVALRVPLQTDARATDA